MVDTGTNSSFSIQDLIMALLANNEALIEKIICSSLDLNCTFREKTVLSEAVIRQNLRGLQLLLSWDKKRQFDVNKRSRLQNGRLEPPLITACRNKDLAIAKVLLEYGADVNVCDGYNHTALWIAVRERNLPMVRWLVERGAKVNLCKSWEANPLYLAARYASREQMLVYLIQSGADVNVLREADSKTLLSWSCFHRYRRAVQLLVLCGYPVRRDLAALTDELAPDGDALRPVDPAWRHWLVHVCASPLSLRNLCRISVRNLLGSLNAGAHFQRSVASLPITDQLKSFIFFDNI